MPLPAAAHISHRAHLFELPEQGGKKLFGLSLCAAPYFEGAAQPPLLTTADHELDPYLPWAWSWRGDAGGGPAAPGFRWTLLVQLEKTSTPGTLEWKVVPERDDADVEVLKVYAKPPGFNDDLAVPGTAPTATVHDTWWRTELQRLTVSAGAWKMNGAPKPLAHAKQLERFYGVPGQDSIVIKDGQHDTHADLLGARMLRWATAHPPYNYQNALAAVVECRDYAGLTAALGTAYPLYTVSSTSLRIAAVPLWVTDGVAPGWDDWREQDPTLMVEQRNVPDDGAASGTVFTRRSYGNIVTVVPNQPQPAPAAAALAVDIEPWRKELEDRVARCADLATLLLDAAADATFQPVVAPRLTEWVVGLSADLFQVGWELNDPKPRTAGEWALQLMKGAVDAKLEEVELARLEAVLPLLPATFSLRFPDYRYRDNQALRTELTEALVAPLSVLQGLHVTAADATQPERRAKAQRALAKLAEPTAAERGHLQALHDSDAPVASLANPKEDLELYLKLRTVIDGEDAAAPNDPLLREAGAIQADYPKLARSGEVLQGLLAVVPDGDVATRPASIQAALRGFLQVLHDPQLFYRLRAQVAHDGVSAPPESDHVRVALRESLRFLVTDTRSLKADVLPQLNEGPTGGSPETNRPVQPVITGLLARLSRRIAHPTEAEMHASELPPPQKIPLKDPAPPLFDDGTAGPIVTAWGVYLDGIKAETFRNTTYGDRSIPLSRPHGLSIVLQEEQVFDSHPDMEANADLSQTAGGLLFARAAKPADLDTTPWLALNTGVLRLRPVDATGQPTGILQAGLSILDPLRPTVLNQRLSRRADYDNRPLVALSREDALNNNSDNRPRPTDDLQRQSALLDFVLPAGATIPALRYRGPDVHFQFCWLDLDNACAFRGGLWTNHPALLTALPLAKGDLRAKGIAVSDGTPYLRRAGIAPVGLSAAEFLPCSLPHGGTMEVVKENEWPLLLPGIFPLAAELETTGGTQAKSPLVLLFPRDQGLAPALNQPEGLVQEITVQLHRPRTDDDNWERWAGADPQTPQTLAARIKICAEAHLFRDQAPPSVGTRREDPWHPNDPAVAPECLIVFRQVYPRSSTPAKVGFVRTWANDAAYGVAAPYFSTPITATLERGAAAGSLVQASTTGFMLEEGFVVEMAVYALLPTTSLNRFLPELQSSLGDTVAHVLAGVTVPETGTEPAGTWLALEPTLLRLETPHLELPSAEEAYKALRVSRQGGKVSVSVAAERAGAGTDTRQFDLVHEVIVQEQIWRWSGKPSMPEDFLQEDGTPAIALPHAGELVEQHLPWDGIAFHQREDGEHLATACKLPLPATPPPASAATPATPEADLLFTDDKESDARALYFRFSALYRSRYFGAWPGARQAGTTAADGRIDPLWKRFVLPHRLLTPLKKPSVLIVIPLLAGGRAGPAAGDTAGCIAIVRESCFEQAGLGEVVRAQLVESDTFQRNATTGFVEPTGTRFFQAGYDPILSTTALPKSCCYPNPNPPPATLPRKSFVRMSGPVGLTFDQGSRDPLIVNSLFFLEIDRAKLAAMPVPGSTNPPAAHLFGQIRFQRTIRRGYEVDGDFGDDHPLASPWTEAQWVKFLPDSDLLRPSHGDSRWRVENTGTGSATASRLENWIPPDYGLAVHTALKDRFIHLFCITRHDLDALGRPATEFHSLYYIGTGGVLTAISPNPTGLTASPRLRARVLQVLAVQDGLTLAPETWRGFFFPDEHPGVSRAAGPITEDAQLVPQALSAAWPLEVT